METANDARVTIRWRCSCGAELEQKFDSVIVPDEILRVRSRWLYAHSHDGSAALPSQIPNDAQARV